MNAAKKRKLRQIAHHLDPVVTVGDKGLSDTVLAEAIRALRDHELIKVKLAAGEREDRRALADAVAKDTNSELVYIIGKIAVLYKENTNADPRLSNIKRHGS